MKKEEKKKSSKSKAGGADDGFEVVGKGGQVAGKKEFDVMKCPKADVTYDMAGPGSHACHCAITLKRKS